MPMHSQTNLLCNSRLVSMTALRCAYDVGLAATAGGGVTFENIYLDLNDEEYAAVEKAYAAVHEAHKAYFWTRPLTEEEFNDAEIGYGRVRTLVDQLRECRTRQQKIRAAVANCDVAIPKLLALGFVLTVTTTPEEFAPVPDKYMPEFAFSAVVAVEPRSWFELPCTAPNQGTKPVARLDQWCILPKGTRRRLSGHSSLGKPVSSTLIALSPDGRWAETKDKVYLLGSPAGALPSKFATSIDDEIQF